ncbi:MAG: dihydropyrimidinase [Pseudomonadota bacterium]
MMYDLIIKNGTILTSQKIFKSEIAVKNEKIVEIAKKIQGSAKEVIDASGLYVMPGGIDVHVHFENVFSGYTIADDFESGSISAAAGGVTTFIDFANQDPKTGLLGGVKQRIAQAAKKSCVDFSVHATITDWSLKTKKQMQACIDFGVPSFKMFTIYEERGLKSEDHEIFQALEESKKKGALIMIHAESEKVMNHLIEKYSKDMKKFGAYAHALSRPNYIEAEAVSRMIKWAEVTKGNLYIVHMSTGEASDLIKNAKSKGLNVDAETSPIYLTLTDDLFKKENGHFYATCPQLKKKKDCTRLWQGLKAEIEIISTDTCPFSIKDKNKWKGDFRKIAYGLPGVETMIPILYTEGVLKEKVSLKRFVSLVSENPAKKFGLYPKKGCIEVGADADFTIFHPTKKKLVKAKNLKSKCDFSPFEGKKLAAFPEYTILRGRTIYQNEQCFASKGSGKLLRRKLLIKR